MQLQEAFNFLTEVAYIAFPAARKFVLMNSKDPKSTTESHAKALLSLSRDECQAVIDSWLTGLVDPPTDEDYANFGLTIRSAAMANRFKKAASKPLDDIRRVDAGNQARVPIRPYIERLMALKRQRQNGELSQEELERLSQAVMDEHQQACGLSVSPPVAVAVNDSFQGLPF